ncbi:MAG: four helix bundle protein, partial [Candidatus Bipolaricaulota bacterium]
RKMSQTRRQLLKIENFEDIKSWQKARELTSKIYEITSSGGFSKDYGLRDQIQRASVSIMANIAEGFGADSNHEFIKFLNYSRRSATEVQSHLYVALDQEYITQKQFNKIYKNLTNLKKLINGFIKYLKKPE